MYSCPPGAPACSCRILLGSFQCTVKFLKQDVMLHTSCEWASLFDSTEDDYQGMSPALSECARFAPRFGGAVRRFALRALID